MFNNIQNIPIIHLLFPNLDQIYMITSSHHNNFKQWLIVANQPTKVEKLDSTLQYKQTTKLCKLQLHDYNGRHGMTPVMNLNAMTTMGVINI